MRRLFPLVCALILTSGIAFASDQLRDVQTELKNQGFFYGEVDGKPSAELNAAVRRYQIRNGLEVTGDLSAGTLKALGLGNQSEPPPVRPPGLSDQTPPSTPPKPAPVAPKTTPPVDLRRDDSDRRALEEEQRRPNRPNERSVVRPPVPLDPDTATEPSGPYSALFSGTPYASAPRVVQEQTVRRAQSLLATRGFYRDAVDGAAGPATEEAVLSFQRKSRLPLTGRLDLQTLAMLNLLPGRGQGNPPMQPYKNAPERGARQQVYRGIWVE